MKKNLLCISVLTLATSASAGFNGDPALNSYKICDHVDQNGVVETRVMIPASQSCPSYNHTIFKDGVRYSIQHVGSSTIISPPMADPSNPTCYNRETLLPRD